MVAGDEQSDLPSGAPEAIPADGRIAHDLGFALLRHAAAGQQGQFLISPHSIASALLLAWNGAAGETREAIARVVGLTPGTGFDELDQAWGSLDQMLSSSDPKLQLAIANSLWARQDVKLLPAYLERVGRAFTAELRNLELSAAEAAGIINGWVDERTGGKIDTIVPDPIPPGVALYLINAIYFKGEWSERFERDATQPRDFHTDSGTRHKVSMMERFGAWHYTAQEGLQVVRLPYSEGRFAMYVVLPAPGQLDAWLAGVDGDKWETLVSSMTEADGLVVLPQLRFGYMAKLRQPLSDLGMEIAFTEEADFSALTPRSVAISEVFHKTFIEVNEEGSEAAAATAVEEVDVAIAAEPFELIADHPFFFAIRDDQTRTLLFVGLVRSMD
jgi:serpin B